MTHVDWGQSQLLLDPFATYGISLFSNWSSIYISMTCTSDFLLSFGLKFTHIALYIQNI